MTQLNGKLISIEGGEGAGKSTVLHAIRCFLEHHGYVVVCTREPGGTKLGEQVRQLLLEPNNKISAKSELLLMFASRAQHVEEVIKPELANGHMVVSDRFTDASFAYQGGGRGIDDADIAELECRFVGLMPDLTLLLDLGVHQGLARAQSRGQAFDRIELEKTDFFERVREAYLRRAAQNPERIKIIDASKSAEEVVQAVELQLAQWLQARC
ncbi:MAG: dTMP kinase [Arenimonas sp.]|nr:dTMP kinase [Arenimonas sp.]